MFTMRDSLYDIEFAVDKYRAMLEPSGNMTVLSMVISAYAAFRETAVNYRGMPIREFERRVERTVKGVPSEISIHDVRNICACKSTHQFEEPLREDDDGHEIDIDDDMKAVFMIATARSSLCTIS